MIGQEVGKKMVYSMTGYGRCEIEANDRKVTVEMNAINHRYCDLNIRMPRTLAALEEQVRNYMKQNVARGKFDISIFCYSQAQEDLEILVNETMANSYLESLKQLGERFGLDNDVKLSHLMAMNELITIQKKTGDVETVSQALGQALEGALAELMQMRLKEGEALKEDLLFKAEKLEALVEEVNERSPEVVKDYKFKLEARLEALLSETPIDENRMAAELALFADKCAIDEELTRLRSHILQLQDILQAGGVIGRKLDFLMQEMNREVNTIGSKANDYEITKYVVELKTEIEKIREQVQNIE